MPLYWAGKKNSGESIRKKSRESSSTTTLKWHFLSGFHRSSLDLDFKSYEVLRLGKTTSTNWIKFYFSQLHETWNWSSPSNFEKIFTGANYYPKLIIHPNDLSFFTLKNCYMRYLKKICIVLNRDIVFLCNVMYCRTKNKNFKKLLRKCGGLLFTRFRGYNTTLS